MLVGTEAEVLDGLTAVLGATEDQGVATSGGTKSKLVQSDSFATSGHNAGTGGGGEAESRNSNLGAGEKTVVVSNGADDDDGALLALLVDVGNDARQGNGRTVDLGHEESAEDNLVEGRVGTTYIIRQYSGMVWVRASRKKRTGKEAVKLYEELKVDIVALRRLAVRRLDVVAVEINTCRKKQSSAQNLLHALAGSHSS